MKIVYTPISTLVPSLTPEQDAEILAAAGEDSVLVVAKTPDRQREEIVDADVLFGRVSRRSSPRRGGCATTTASARVWTPSSRPSWSRAT